MRGRWRYPIPIIVTILLAGCWFPPGSPPLPTVGPIYERSGKPAIFDSELTISTNCVEVGETLVIKGRIKNEASYPLQFEGIPAFDFIIQPGDWDRAAGPEPVRRWSQTADY